MELSPEQLEFEGGAVAEWNDLSFRYSFKPFTGVNLSASWSTESIGRYEELPRIYRRFKEWKELLRHPAKIIKKLLNIRFKNPFYFKENK